MSDCTPKGAFNEAASPELRRLMESMRSANGSGLVTGRGPFITKNDIDASKIKDLQKFVDDRIKKLVIEPLNEIREALKSSNVKYGIKMMDHLVDSLQGNGKSKDEVKP